MLRLTDVSIARGTRTLYQGASVVAGPGERVALVGENGAGKSSLFAAILGELSPETGSIEAPSPDRIAHVAQSVEQTELTTLQYVMGGHAPWVAAQAELQAAQQAHDTMREAATLAHLAELNEGAIRAQALTVMAGLGFMDADRDRLVRTFSGGWRNRLSLARALLAPADLLLLDEPTNHLDMDSLIWLEAWLKRVQSTVIIISHDREFLDRAVQTTWAIEDGKLTRYGGHYSFYEMQRIQALEQQQAAHKAYARQAAHLTAFIERFRYKATKARQAQSRIKMLDKLQVIEPVRAARQWRFAFDAPERTPEQLAVLEGVRLGYDERTVLRDVTLTIRAGERIGVLGVNGAGKSTLIKALVGELGLQAGSILRGQGLVVGYFAQHQLESLDARETPLEVMQRKASTEREQVLREHLGRFRFSGDMVHARIATLSGGEKARLALALIVWDKPNLLVLDEPTNHLDMATREALTVALSSFDGALLLVSHDRHLMRSTCDRLVLVHEGLVSAYEGDLDDYAQLVLEHRKTVLAAERQAARTATESQPALSRKEQRKLQAEQRNRIAALRKPLAVRLQRIEKDMQALSAEIASLDAQLADPEWYASAQSEAITQVTYRRGKAQSSLDELEQQWLEVSEQLEAIDQDNAPSV